MRNNLTPPPPPPPPEERIILEGVGTFVSRAACKAYYKLNILQKCVLIFSRKERNKYFKEYKNPYA